MGVLDPTLHQLQGCNAPIIRAANMLIYVLSIGWFQIDEQTKEKWGGGVGGGIHWLRRSFMMGLSVAVKPKCGKPEFGSCHTRVRQLPNPSLVAAAAKPEFGSYQT